MTREEIMARFNTPSYLKICELRQENEILRKRIRQNESTISKLAPDSELEGDKAADKLDKEFPLWRRVLVQELKK